jgi:GNAT superfamily N-acetyltransferase
LRRRGEARWNGNNTRPTTARTIPVNPWRVHRLVGPDVGQKMNTMKVTELIESDLEALAGLYKQFWGEDSSLEKMHATFQSLRTNPNYIFLVARRDGRLAGSVMGIVCEELYGECKPFMVVEDVIVDQNHRRQGVGSLLMRELERLAISRDCAYIIFVTEQDRTTAHQFYESLGYNPDKYRGFKKRLGGGQQLHP